MPTWSSFLLGVTAAEALSTRFVGSSVATQIPVRVPTSWASLTTQVEQVRDDKFMSWGRAKTCGDQSLTLINFASRDDEPIEIPRHGNCWQTWEGPNVDFVCWDAYEKQLATWTDPEQANRTAYFPTVSVAIEAMRTATYALEDSPFWLKMLGMTTEDGYTSFMMEDGSSNLKMLTEHRKLSTAELAKLFRDAVQGLRALDSHQFSVPDFDPELDIVVTQACFENVMSDDCVAKMANHGDVCTRSAYNPHQVQSCDQIGEVLIEELAPEVMRGQFHSTQSHMWTLALHFLELESDLALNPKNFPHGDSIAEFADIVESRVHQFTTSMDQNNLFTQTLASILVPEDERITAAEALNALELLLPQRGTPPTQTAPTPNCA